jgi:hypothetical protein
MTKITKRVSAIEAIAVHLCSDESEIKDYNYQPSLFPGVKVYSIGEDYFCSPRKGQKPPTLDRDGQERGFQWEKVFEWQGREVFYSKVAE